MPIPNRCHLGLLSNQPLRLREFYVKKLGFTEGESRTIARDLMQKIFNLPVECRMLKLHRQDSVLEIFAPQGLELLPSHDNLTGINHFGIWVQDKEAFCTELAAQDVPVIKAAYKDRFIYFVQDPEGNRIEVFEA